MIDLRCHLLDDTGCGPASFAESLELCCQAAQNGVRSVIATPRWNARAHKPPLSFADCAEKLERLRREVQGALSLKLGFLMQFRSDLAMLLEQHGTRLTLGGGRYVFVALPSLRIPSDTEEVWEAVRQKGFAIVVARPECSPVLRRNPSRLGQWVASGVKLQLDAASITGVHGREVKSFALNFVREYSGSVVVASNACVGRTHHSSLKQARAELIKKNGSHCAQLLFSETPAAILRTETGLISDDPAPTTHSKPFSRLRSLRLPKAIFGES